MPRFIFALLAVLAVTFSPSAEARDYLHASASVSLSTTAVCTPVGLIDATRVDSSGVKVRNAPEHLQLLESDLTTIVTAVTLTVRLYRDSACEDPLTDPVAEGDLDDDADASGGSATKIDVIHTPHGQNDTAGQLFVRAVLDAGTATAAFRLSAVSAE